MSCRQGISPQIGGPARVVGPRQFWPPAPSTARNSGETLGANVAKQQSVGKLYTFERDANANRFDSLLYNGFGLGGAIIAYFITSIW